MKIAIFADSYHPYTSGVVHSIETFKDELIALGHDISIFAPDYPRKYEHEKNVYRFPSIIAPTNKDFALAIPFSAQPKKIFKVWRPDIIHVHSPFLLGKLGAKFAYCMKVPLVFTFHTMYEEYVHYFPLAQKISKKVMRIVARNFCNKCDLVIVPTTVIEEYLKKIRVSRPIEVIPTGIKIDEFAFGERYWLREKYGIPKQEKILLFVGRLGIEKNINFLINAYLKVIKEMPQTRLILVGGGPQEKELKRSLHQEVIQNKVIFTGKLPKNEVIKYYAGADLFVFASVTETQGLVLAEAKAAGLPVVAVKALGASEMVRDGEDGFLTELNINDFTNKIILLLSNGFLREEFVQRAKRNVINISSRSCALRLIRTYHSGLTPPSR